jgi:hypothetical protein
VEDEQWEDFDDESEEDKVTEYRLATHRRSSIDLMSTLANDSDSMMRCNDSGSNMDASTDVYGSKDGLIVDFSQQFPELFSKTRCFFYPRRSRGL